MKKLKLGDVCLSITDGTHTTVVDDKSGTCFLLSCKNIKNGCIMINENDRKISVSTMIQLRNRTKMEMDDVLLTTVGTIGQSSIVKDNFPNYEFQRSVAILKPNKDIINHKYLHYFLISPLGQNLIRARIKGAVQSCLFLSDIKELKICVPNLFKQQHIVNILGTIDDKIENNEKIISNLLNLANAKYLYFVAKNSFQIKKIDDVFDIAIGRTPPRKENEWFTIEPDGMKWISIADMGKCDGYIFNTSENLTYEAVKSFNIPIIPENTVILSFKLTVGRIAITTGKMISNEAIAHFKTDNYKLTPYLYLFLKNYDFNKLGSTSSIATATNSKAVKSINFPLPDANQIDEFYKVINPYFDKIKYLQYVNKKLQGTKNLYLKKFFG